MEKRIILVGCGNIGSRHLQAIAKLPYGIKVDIVEPNDDAQNLAKSRLDEISFDKTDHKFFWYNTINGSVDATYFDQSSTPNSKTNSGDDSNISIKISDIPDSDDIELEIIEYNLKCLRFTLIYC